MLRAVTTSLSRGVPFPEPVLAARLRAASLALLAACAAAMPALALAAGPGAASAALCSPQQRVVFHCSLGAKAVSLCATPVAEDEPITALGYRFGTPTRIELAYEADAATDRRFAASTAALAPGVSVREVWFDRGGYRYVLSQCVGGNCPFAAGLAVLQGQRVLRQQRCRTTADDRAWFAPSLAHFGRDADGSTAKTDLLRFEDDDNGAARLYPLRRR